MKKAIDIDAPGLQEAIAVVTSELATPNMKLVDAREAEIYGYALGMVLVRLRKLLAEAEADGPITHWE